MDRPAEPLVGVSPAHAFEHDFHFERWSLEQEYLPCAGEQSVIEEFRALDRTFVADVGRFT